MLSLLTASLFSTLAAAQCWKNVTCDGPTQAAFPGSWDSNIYASASRAVSPAYKLSWPDLTATEYGPVSLSGNGSKIVYDFGKEVGGLVSISYTSNGTGSLGLAFTEAKDFVGEWSDSSNGKFVGPDGAIYSNFTGGVVKYDMPEERLRGGFRYLTVFLVTDSGAAASVELDNVTTELDFMPTWPNLRAYQGYFHSNDELLNRIWYAGAYTLQSNAVPPNTGRQVPMLLYGWANNATMGPGDTIIVDGAKRDRAVWPGDMGVAVPSTFVSLGDLESVKNALQVMYDYQDTTTGAFDEAGPPLSQKGSDTYHMWTMIGTYNYVLYTADLAFLSRNWAKYQFAMTFIRGKVDSSNLLNVTGIRDWARWQQGFHNTEANTILYHTLITGASLAEWSSNPSLATTWRTSASTLATAINALNYDSDYGAFRDNDTTTTLHPQDANSLALLFNLTSVDRTASISKRLTANWTPIGPETPELPGNISPFISSFELGAHLTAREPDRALDLLRTTWGWILNNENSTQSTLLEGYLTNGSFGYRSSRGYAYDVSYPSHAHGWSSGPTSVLTTQVLGLDVADLAGKAWVLLPQWGDLTSVEGGFTTGLGKFSASWVRKGAGVVVNWNTPDGTNGTVTLPGLGIGQTLLLNGSVPEKGVVTNGTLAGKDVVTFAVSGGKGTVEVL